MEYYEYLRFEETICDCAIALKKILQKKKYNRDDKTHAFMCFQDILENSYKLCNHEAPERYINCSEESFISLQGYIIKYAKEYLHEKKLLSEYGMYDSDGYWEQIKELFNDMTEKACGIQLAKDQKESDGVTVLCYYPTEKKLEIEVYG